MAPFSAAFEAPTARSSSRLYSSLYAADNSVDLGLPNFELPRSTEKVEAIFDMEAQRQKWMQSMYAEEEEATKVLSKSFEENVVPLIKEGEKVISKEFGGKGLQLPTWDLQEFSVKSLQPLAEKISKIAVEGVSKGSEGATSYLLESGKVDPAVVDSVKAYVAENPDVVAGAALFLILLGALQPTQYRDESEPSMIVEALKNKNMEPVVEAVVPVPSPSPSPSSVEAPVVLEPAQPSQEMVSLKEELQKREEEISNLKKVIEESVKISSPGVMSEGERAKLVTEITAEVTVVAEKKYKLQEEELTKALDEVRKKEEAMAKREATTLHAVKQFLVETGELPQGTANMVLTSTIPQVLKDIVKKSKVSNSKDDLAKVTSRLAEMELYLKEKSAENEQLKQKLLGSDETLGVAKKERLLKDTPGVRSGSGTVSDLELNVMIDKERIEIKNPSDREIELSEGYTVADTYPSGKVNLVLPKITIPAGKSLTVFTCPGKDEYARPKSFRGKYIEWKTGRGDLKKSRLFVKGKTVPIFLYSSDGSKV